MDLYFRTTIPLDTPIDLIHITPCVLNQVYSIGQVIDNINSLEMERKLIFRSIDFRFLSISLFVIIAFIGAFSVLSKLIEKRSNFKLIIQQLYRPTNQKILIRINVLCFIIFCFIIGQMTRNNIKTGDLILIS